MNLFNIVLIAALGVAGTSFATIEQNSQRAGVAISETESWPTAHYRLSVIGHEETCSVALKNPSSVTVGSRCRMLFQPLSDARFWQEMPNGDILFVNAEGGTVAQFFPGDGVAYESVRPQAPLMMLVPL